MVTPQGGCSPKKGFPTPGFSIGYFPGMRAILMKIAKVLSGVSVVAGWGMLLSSVATYLLYWRIENEPAKGPPEMLAAIIGLVCLGVILFVGGNALLLYWRAKRPLALTWIFVVLETAAACLLSPLLLVFLV
jgi:hypothetical protein